MKKFLKKPVTIIFLVIYCLLNFSNFAGATICVAKDHIGLNFFGYDKCCIEKRCKSADITSNTCSHINSKETDDCYDKHLTTNSNELMPDNYTDLAYILPFENVIDFIIINCDSFIQNTNEIKARAPDNPVLSAYKTIRLTI